MLAGLRSALGFGHRARAASDGLESGRMSRRLAGWVPARDHVNTLIQSSGGTTRARARYLVRNNGYAQNAVECFAANAVGTGIVPSWKPKAGGKTLAEKGKALWTAWTDDADSEGLTDLYGLQRRLARELFIAGECFVRRRPRRLSDGLSVPLQLQMLPSEMLDLNYTLVGDNGNLIRQGIEFDGIGRRVAYHFWKRHPGDTTESMLGLGERTVVPASEVLHVYDPLEAGQVRGLSRLTPAIVGLWVLDAYDDAELERKRVAALFTAFVKSDADGQIFDKDAEAKARASDGIAEVRLQPGTTQVLLPGEDITVAAPADVGNNYEPFQYRALTRFCAAVGLPYAGVTGDLVRANYANQRAALVEARRRLEAVQHSVLVFQFCRPVWRWFLDGAAISGGLAMPGYGDDPSPYLTLDWIPPKWDWVDPVKDVQAEILAVNAGFKPRSASVAATGADPIEVDEQIAADQKRAKELGISFAGTASPKTEVAAAPASDIAANDQTTDPAADPNAPPAARSEDQGMGRAMEIFAEASLRQAEAAKLQASKPPINVHLPKVDVHVPDVVARVEIPEQKPPVVHVKAPIVNVAAPVVNYVPPKRGKEVTKVTAWDDKGRIKEFERTEEGV